MTQKKLRREPAMVSFDRFDFPTFFSCFDHFLRSALNLLFSVLNRLICIDQKQTNLYNRVIELNYAV